MKGMEIMKKYLWLFDVDGTLVDTTRQHLNAYQKSYAVVTGIIVPDAVLSGLFDFFSIISGDDGKSERENIVRRAIVKAVEINYVYDRVVVIEDTPTDIFTGRKFNAFTVGVATGYYSLAELQKENPTIAVENLIAYKSIMSKLQFLE